MKDDESMDDVVWIYDDQIVKDSKRTWRICERSERYE